MSRITWFVLLTAGLCMGLCRTAAAQNNGGNNNNVGGIRIDADGVVQMAIQHDPSPKLDAKRRALLAKQALPGEVSEACPQRLVSLVELEKTCARLIADGKPLPLDVRYLAGLTRLEAVFLDPDRQDLLIAGPAEPFAASESGRVLGLESGRPVLRLDDLIVALRSVQPRSIVGVSIDPVPAQLARFQQFVTENSTPADPAVIEQRFRRMREILGHHDVRLTGIPVDSHFARGLLEADYRMKLLALGLEQPGVKGFKSHLSMAGKGNAIQRWWFVPFYEGILRSADGLAYEFSGQRVQLLGENELANAAGERSQAVTQKVSTHAFSRQFTEKFPQLAEKLPIFAELQQLVDWTVLAALIRQERLAEQVEWKPSLFLDAEALPHEVWPVARQTACLVNTKRTSGGLIVGQLSGGVTVAPDDVIARFTPADDSLSAQRVQALQRDRPQEHAWWRNGSDAEPVKSRAKR